MSRKLIPGLWTCLGTGRTSVKGPLPFYPMKRDYVSALLGFMRSSHLSKPGTGLTQVTSGLIALARFMFACLSKIPGHDVTCFLASIQRSASHQ